jgi:DNA-directed RNA polymerase specialized sigma24 family protein
MPPPPTNLDAADARELEAIYKLHFNVLSEMAVSEFHLPHGDAEELAHDILIAAIRSSPRITDLTTWLRGAVTCAAAEYNGERV